MTMNVFEQLIKELDAKRHELGMSDTEFAHKLGVSKATWSFTKSGQYMIGDKIAGSIALHFPELGPLCLQYQAEKRRQGMKVNQRPKIAAIS